MNEYYDRCHKRGRRRRGKKEREGGGGCVSDDHERGKRKEMEKERKKERRQELVATLKWVRWGEGKKLHILKKESRQKEMKKGTARERERGEEREGVSLHVCWCIPCLES